MTLLDRGTVRRVPPGDLVVDVADSRLGCVDAQHGDVVAYYELWIIRIVLEVGCAIPRRSLAWCVRNNGVHGLFWA